jgi:hypothetical protein
MEGAPSSEATTIVIVGVGIVGSALSHFPSSSPKIRQYNKTKVIVVDNSVNPLMGSTAHAPGFLGLFNELPVLTRLAIDNVTE